jgi:hypothetical protein
VSSCVLGLYLCHSGTLLERIDIYLCQVSMGCYESKNTFHVQFWLMWNLGNELWQMKTLNSKPWVTWTSFTVVTNSQGCFSFSSELKLKQHAPLLSLFVRVQSAFSKHGTSWSAPSTGLSHKSPPGCGPWSLLCHPSKQGDTCTLPPFYFCHHMSPT